MRRIELEERVEVTGLRDQHGPFFGDFGGRYMPESLIAAIDEARGLTFVGLMAIPPLGADADAAFARLAQERERVQQWCGRPLELSAGMSGDLEAAVRHGTTCVRVGTALLGARPLTSPPEVTRVTPSSQTTESSDSPESGHRSSPHEGSSQ